METPESAPRGAFFSTDRSVGYNCSQPLRGVLREKGPDGLAAAPAPALMLQTTRRASPRLASPTDDDADGLRYLYPECDQLTECETFPNGTGCKTYTGTYTCEDAFDCGAGEDSYEGESFGFRRMAEAYPYGADAENAGGRRLSEDAANASFYSSRPQEWTHPMPAVRCVRPL